MSDGTLSASQTFTVTINGVNDAAIISGTTTGAVIEAGGATARHADRDRHAHQYRRRQSAQHLHGGWADGERCGYGSFTMTAAGVWTYTLDNANSAVQALNAGGTLTDTFTVTTVDGTTKLVTITITGSNDAAVISGTTTGAVIEAGGSPMPRRARRPRPARSPIPTSTIRPTPSRRLGRRRAMQATAAFTMTAAGVWTYTLDNANGAVQALNAGGT